MLFANLASGTSLLTPDTNAMPAKESGHKLQRSTNGLQIGYELLLVLQAEVLLDSFTFSVVGEGQTHEPDYVVLQSDHQGGPLVVAVVTLRVTDTVQE